MTKLSPAVSRLLAAALLVAAIAIPYRLLIAPLLDHFAAYAADAATQEDLLVRYRRLADSRPQLRERLVEIQEGSAAQSGYLSGDSETLVAAELQNLIRTTVERNGGKLESTQILSAVTEDQFRRVTLRVRMVSDTETLFRTLYDIESALPYLFLDNLDIVSRDSRTGRNDANQQGATLTVGYDVYGYMRGS